MFDKVWPQTRKRVSKMLTVRVYYCNRNIIYDGINIYNICLLAYVIATTIICPRAFSHSNPKR